MYWLISRLIGGDPEGLGVASPGSRVLGLLMTVLGVYVLVAIISRVLRQRMDEDARSGSEVVEAFEADRLGRPTAGEPAAPAPAPAPANGSAARPQWLSPAVGLSGVAVGVLIGTLLHRLRLESHPRTQPDSVAASETR
ncbi:hypothetical protein [Geodermatophilus tzadiensis]|uniref:hypothetical protein n=1 Tax=Geodermatophilus tzadiensis TaxID=1137988 RepID=UPI0011B246C1|nr:hypothetical protein [Geodermatophilus tzadiensis]